MYKKEINIETGSQENIVDITDDVLRYTDTTYSCVTLYMPHSSCAITTAEHGTEKDLMNLLQRILPKDIDYFHQHSGRLFHARDHLISSLFSTSLTIPILDERLALGVWQRIVVIDTNTDNLVRRLIIMSH
jgi:secondary thiamine-phosphate synthase enzyme